MFLFEIVRYPMASHTQVKLFLIIFSQFVHKGAGLGDRLSGGLGGLGGGLSGGLGGLTNNLPGIGGGARGGNSRCPLRNTKEAIAKLIQGVQADIEGLASNAQGLSKDQISSLTEQMQKFVKLATDAQSKGLGETIQTLFKEMSGVLSSIAQTLQQLLKAGINPRQVLPQTTGGVTHLIGSIIQDLGRLEAVQYLI